MELGTAWLRLTKGEQGEKSRKAIAALEKALTVFTAESEPLRWVLTQMDLGCAWSNLPDGDHDSNLKKAIAAYERAVMVNRDTTNTNVTNAWSLAPMNLGSARSEMFTRSGDGENLLKAIAAYDAALSVFNRGTPATLFATAHVRRAACFLVMSELPGQEGGPLLSPGGCQHQGRPRCLHRERLSQGARSCDGYTTSHSASLRIRRLREGNSL